MQMNKMYGKKLLVLGGRPIGSCEIVNRAKQMGIYTIVTDYLDKDKSPAKLVADDCWDISTADVSAIAKKAKEVGIDGIYTGVHEFNIKKMIQLCSILKLPCFCTEDQWNQLENKQKFKKICREHKIPVSKEYMDDDVLYKRIPKSEYPIIMKPADGSGSRGFSICYSDKDLDNAYEKAKTHTPTGNVLIEQFMDYRYSVIINYTILNGEPLYGGMSDKRSRKVFDDGAPIMSFQCYPSAHEEEYLKTLDNSVKQMLKDLKVQNGVIWIEAFYSNGVFTFNEMGFRFGGSLTYYHVEFFYGINQLDVQLEYALTGCNKSQQERRIIRDQFYCILPIHVKPGLIMRIEGLDELKIKPYIQKIVPVHYLGDTIENWGSAQQVFAYIHFIVNEKGKIEETQSEIMQTVHVYDVDGKELLFNLFDDSCIV